jgi:L-threonylcarbamoyladenylate synthase
MTTEVVTLDPQRLDKDVLQHAADILRRGGLVAFPTETVYGLGADATNPQAVARIFEAKGRPATNPTIVHIADVSAAKACAAKWPKEADEVANAFWPGPLTIIVPAAPLALLKAAGKPIAAPSANRSESLSPTTAEHVLRTLDGRIDLILDGGPTTGGLESSVVDLSVAPPRLLRPGLISLEELRAVLPDLEVGASTDATIVSNSPGQLPRHYAPKTPLELVADMNERLNRSSHLSVGVVTFGGKRLSANFGRRLVERTLLNDPLAAAQSLYAVLHELDAMNLDLIVVELPPVGDDWSAIRDRLQRASTPAE